MATYTTSKTSSFTVVHARRIASKVATDLMRFHRYYGSPSTSRIDQFDRELVELLQHNAVDEVTYGFRKNNQWITAVKYKAVDGELVADDVPGSLRAVDDLNGATFGSFLAYSTAWFALSATERERIEARLPFERGVGDEPTVQGGYWADDLSYSAGGRGLRRASIRRY